VPKADKCTAAKQHLYSITSSVRSLEIDDQFEFGWFHRKVRCLLGFEDAIGLASRALIEDHQRRSGRRR
jgi:hypothetical protein